MRELQYHRVDVFTDRAFGGNPLAVFTDAQGLATELMQAIAKEMNLSECSFVLPPTDRSRDFRVRIFTPAVELPMAGHPTVGTSFVLARQGYVERNADVTHLTFEEGVGPIPVSIEYSSVGDEPRLVTMTQPNPTFGPRFEDAGAIAAMLSLDVEAIRTELPVEVVSCGVPFLYVPLRSLEDAHKIEFRHDLCRRTLHDFPTSSIFASTEEVETEGSTVHSRMFAPDLGVGEDPATGAASGPLGCYLVRYGIVPAQGTARIVSEQGLEMGRPSYIQIEIDREGDAITAVRVGGQCRYIGHGSILLEMGNQGT